jgi:hypothetical protein
VTVAWFAFPDQRFVVIPAIIVVIYLITIYVLAKRPRPQLQGSVQTEGSRA